MPDPSETLFVSYSPLLGGAERILLDMAEPGAPIACPDGPLAVAARAAGHEVVPLAEHSLELRRDARDRIAAPLRLAAFAREVRAAVRARAPRLVVGWSMRAALASAAALRTMPGRPALLFQHNDLLPGPAIARAVRAAARAADAVVCLSEAIATDLDPAGRLGDRLRVVHPGVALERFPLVPNPPGPPELVTLGAIVGWKRPDLALEAVAIAARLAPELRLTFVGGPLDEAGEQLLAALRRRAERPDLAGRVTFTGALPDPRPALAAATALLHCSDREPFGLALVEALASGRPVVAPAAGGPVEIVDATCGRLFTPGDAHDAARALVETIGAAKTGGLGPGPCRARAERFTLRGSRERWQAAARSAVERSPATRQPARRPDQ